jgi:hypothetical protein
MAKINVIHFNFAIGEGQSPELSDIIMKSPYYSKYAKRLHSIPPAMYSKSWKSSPWWIIERSKN